MHSIANNVRHSLATHTLQYSDPSKFVIKINLISFVATETDSFFQ